MFGIGIIGAGSFGAIHAQAIAQLSNARLVAASRTNAEALERFTRQWGGRGYRDYAGLLADREVDVVAISAPPTSTLKAPGWSGNGAVQSLVRTQSR